ncbi:MAG: NepR family anti-sigma factor [Dongiaceae bacterium]
MAGAERKFPGARGNAELLPRDGDAADASSADPHQQKNRMTKSKKKTGEQRDVAVERWFDRQLNQLYSDVISEPLPKEFLELIEKLREKTSK